MKKTRIIVRLDVKNQYVIKGIQLEGLRKIGDPIEMARKYYAEGADEIVFMDAVASLYQRNNLFHIIEKACEEVFIPITIGGGLRSLQDIDLALKAGADKVAINTSAVQNPTFVSEASKVYGSQCIVGSIQAKRKPNGWEAYIESGREETGKDAIAWAKELEDLGAGEIFITSVDRDGTKQGYDRELIELVSEQVRVPVIACGGAQDAEDVAQTAKATKVDALALASALHYDITSLQEIKASLTEAEVPVRMVEPLKFAS